MTGAKPHPRSWTREILAVFTKDVRSELRTPGAVLSIVLYALIALVVISFTVQTYGWGLTQRPDFTTGDTLVRRLLLAALLWIILFFSAISGMARVFAKEEERRTALLLRLAARPLAVYFGKLLFNVMLLGGVGAVVAPLFVLFFQPRIASGGLLVAEIAAGCVAMAATATILGAIVARSGGSSPLLGALAFPLLLVVLVIAINGTAGAFAGGEAAGKARNQLIGMVSYMVTIVTISAMLFEQVWEA
jgi:heme exporter protein B